ncbi:hypothetical protein [Specibacter sp. NPDC078692]|uniref:hypothetical protein n=1 Tax=Specibacter sp. NPDC078692 TaxID=3155818 RepID=UPI0034393B86
MTNQLFLEVLEGRIPLPVKPNLHLPVLLDEWQMQALRNIFGSDAFQDFIKPLVAAGIVTLPLPTEPRARALAAKQRLGQGPPSAGGWRGRERTTKFRSQ